MASRDTEWPDEAYTARWRVGVAQYYYRLLKEYAKREGVTARGDIRSKIKKAEIEMKQVTECHSEVTKDHPRRFTY